MEKCELADDINVLFVQAQSFPAGIQPAFKELESKLTNVPGRKFYGISWGNPDGKINYLAAASQLNGDEARQTGLQTFTIRKGIYMSQLIKDFMNDIPKIGETFTQLLRHPALDTKAYCVERYKGNDVLCMVKLDSIKMK